MVFILSVLFGSDLRCNYCSLLPSHSLCFLSCTEVFWHLEAAFHIFHPVPSWSPTAIMLLLLVPLDQYPFLLSDINSNVFISYSALHLLPSVPQVSFIFQFSQFFLKWTFKYHGIDLILSTTIFWLCSTASGFTLEFFSTVNCLVWSLFYVCVCVHCACMYSNSSSAYWEPKEAGLNTMYLVYFKVFWIAAFMLIQQPN